MSKQNVLLELIRQFDKLRTEHSKLTKDKDECATQIKSLIGDRLDVPVAGYRVSYRYDADKAKETIDLIKFAQEQPKLYKKYVKVETVPGPRRLVIQAVEEL